MTTIVQELPSLPVQLGDSVTLQCTVLSESDKLFSLKNASIYWFKAAPNKSYPSWIYIHGNSLRKCKRIPDEQSARKCVYNFSLNNIRFSDAGTYYCAIATCGQILFENGTKLEIEDITTYV